MFFVIIFSKDQIFGKSGTKTKKSGVSYCIVSRNLTDFRPITHLKKKGTAQNYGKIIRESKQTTTFIIS